MQRAVDLLKKTRNSAEDGEEAAWARLAALATEMDVAGRDRANPNPPGVWPPR